MSKRIYINFLCATQALEDFLPVYLFFFYLFSIGNSLQLPGWGSFQRAWQHTLLRAWFLLIYNLSFHKTLTTLHCKLISRLAGLGKTCVSPSAEHQALSPCKCREKPMGLSISLHSALCRAFPAAPAAVVQCRINEYMCWIMMVCFVTYGLETSAATNQRSLGQVLLYTQDKMV